MGDYIVVLAGQFFSLVEAIPDEVYFKLLFVTFIDVDVEFDLVLAFTPCSNEI